MKRLYLGSNVVLDFVLNREDFGNAAEKLFDAAAQQRAELLVSSLTFITAHYVTSKQTGKVTATQKLATLFDLVSTVLVDAAIISQALQTSAPDFEDAMQLYAALTAGTEAIVTRDPRGLPK